jgi:hypothetical protein
MFNKIDSEKKIFLIKKSVMQFIFENIELQKHKIFSKRQA